MTRYKLVGKNTSGQLLLLSISESKAYLESLAEGMYCRYYDKKIVEVL